MSTYDTPDLNVPQALCQKIPFDDPEGKLTEICQVTLIFIMLRGFRLLQRFTSMVRLDLGAAIQKMLSKKPGALLLSPTSSASSGRAAGAWTANAGS